MKRGHVIMGLAPVALYVFIYIALFIVNVIEGGISGMLYFTFLFYVGTGFIFGGIELAILGVLLVRYRRTALIPPILLAAAFVSGSIYFLFLYRGELML